MHLLILFIFSFFLFKLFDCLKLTLADPVVNPKTGQINRNNDDLLTKVTEDERNNLKIGAKVFINRPCTVNLEAAIDSLLNVLQVECLDNLILAYHPAKTAYTNGTSNGRIPNGSDGTTNLSTSVPKEGVLEWGNASALHDLKKLWRTLENYAEQKKISQLGIADLDTESLTELYTTCAVKPTIAQINLSACCVVPPSLQEFCAKNDIQLLTHSDPEGMFCISMQNEHIVFFIYSFFFFVLFK